MNIVLKRRFGEVSADPTQDFDEQMQPRDTKPMYEITIKDIKRVMALKKVKCFKDFKTNVLNYFRKGKDCSLALKIFDVPDADETVPQKEELKDDANKAPGDLVQPKLDSEGITDKDSSDKTPESPCTLKV